MLIHPDTIDFGQVEYSSLQSRTAMIYNTGNEPLLITGIISSCGCTVPTWSTEAINPEDSSEIEVRYSTYSLGLFKKSVTVYSNDTAGSPKRITVIGEVLQSTGIKQLSNGHLVLFPNPSSGLINISGITQAAEVKIYSIQGKLLKSLHQVETRIDISDLPTGVYFLNLKSGDTVLRKSIVKK